MLNQYFSKLSRAMRLFVILCTTSVLLPLSAVQFPTETINQFSEMAEWSLNATPSGNRFDVIADVIFTHTDSGETRTTGMFYAGNGVFKFRFTGDLPGAWTFSSSSSVTALNGHTGSVQVTAQPDQRGFLQRMSGDKWGWSNTDEAFVPNYVMLPTAPSNWDTTAEVNDLVQRFVVNHGFTGVHVNSLAAYWFDAQANGNRFENNQDLNRSDLSPDPDTFDALEDLMRAVYAEGGVTHIWIWGDQARTQTLSSWASNQTGGINGAVDERLNRYIAARLGPMPGWSMSYSFDVFEWVTGPQLATWHSFLQGELGWFHFLGARGNKDEIADSQLTEVMDYVAYEQHRTSYDFNGWVATMQDRPGKPKISEDRFRNRNKYGKDFDNTDQTRQLMWNLTMAGGLGGIWGYLLPEDDGGSTDYPNQNELKTYDVFWHDQGRFLPELVRGGTAYSTEGTRVLLSPDKTNWIFYRENTSSIQVKLDTAPSSLSAVAVRTDANYAEVDLGTLSATTQTLVMPSTGDWAIAIGEFEAGPPPPEGPTANAGPDQVVQDTDESGSETVQLTAAASTAGDAPIQSYTWRLDGNIESTSVSFQTTLNVGVHDFELTVTDTGNISSTDTVRITVLPDGGLAGPLEVAFISPVPEQSFASGADVAISVAASPDISYVETWVNGTGVGGDWKMWARDNEPPFEFVQTGIPDGEYTLRIRGTDASGSNSGNNTLVAITVGGSGGGDPVADAGADQQVTDVDGDSSEWVVLDGSASSDDTGIASYSWILNASEIATTAQPLVSLPVGTNQVTLRVTDTDGNTAEDVVSVDVITTAQETGVGREDAGTTEKNQAITLDVLANDVAPAGQTLTLVSVSNPANGQAQIVDGKIVFTPDTDFTGTVIFSYDVRASGGGGGGDGVVLDVDLTQGAGSVGGMGTVEGGSWNQGWITGDGVLDGDRIVWDLGDTITHGYAEVKLAVRKVNNQTFYEMGEHKINWFGLYEGAGLTHNDSTDKSYLRTGQSKYGFSRLKLSDRGFDKTEVEATKGNTSSWVFDDSTVHTVRLSWEKNGSAWVHEFLGPDNLSHYTNASAYPQFGDIRYIFIGCDKTYNKSAPGMRFLSLKVVDLDAGSGEGGGSETLHTVRVVVTVEDESEPPPPPPPEEPGWENTSLGQNQASDWDFLGGSWQVNNGVVSQSQNVDTTTATWNAAEAATWKDYGLRVTLNANEDGPDWIGVRLYVQDANNYVLFRMTSDHEGPRRELVEVVGGVANVLASDSGTYEKDTDYVLDMRILDQLVTVKLDGNQIFQGFTTLQQGRFALTNTFTANASYRGIELLQYQGTPPSQTYNLTPEFSADSPRLLFNQRTVPGAAEVELMISTDLETWLPFTGNVNMLNDYGSYKRMSADLSTLIEGADQIYLRVQQK